MAAFAREQSDAGSLGPNGGLSYRWEWQLEASPEALWPLVADTNRFNRDSELPAVEARESEAGANGRRRLRLSRLGIPLEWEEEPFEWVRPQRFSVVRRFISGPVAELRISARLEPRPGGGTLLVYEVLAWPRNLLGRLAIPVQVGLLSRRRFGATFRRYDRVAVAGAQPPAAGEPVRLVPGGQERLAMLSASLIAEGADSALVGRLVETIERGDELLLSPLRPYELADRWHAGRRELLELALRATRAGLLDLRWDMLCPLCRATAASGTSLREVDPQVHCERCQIDFSVNFERSVELTFRPNAAVRKVEERDYCVGGPQLTPHIAAQQLVPAGERRLDLRLEPGRYRLRALSLPGALPVLVAPEGRAQASVRVGGSGWPPDELRLASTASLRIENATGEEQLFVLERTAWSDQAATAAEVTALQVFRDLFSSEALRPGEPISVGTLTVLFTDLRGSTRFYRQIGDAPAFGAVMDHLDLLRATIADEDGALVKTMGDAVMAVFQRPLGAVRAAFQAQRELAAGAGGGTPQVLKVGIHTGPCIAVTQNERLDYFGSTVNVAARLVALSPGGDVIVSGAVASDPEIAALLAGGSGIDAEPVTAELRGFEQEALEVWRLVRRA